MNSRVDPLVCHTVSQSFITGTIFFRAHLYCPTKPFSTVPTRILSLDNSTLDYTKGSKLEGSKCYWMTKHPVILNWFHFDVVLVTVLLHSDCTRGVLHFAHFVTRHVESVVIHLSIPQQLPDNAYTTYLHDNTRYVNWWSMLTAVVGIVMPSGKRYDQVFFCIKAHCRKRCGQVFFV